VCAGTNVGSVVIYLSRVCAETNVGSVVIYLMHVAGDGPELNL
jgi:hypothetical protein